MRGKWRPGTEVAAGVVNFLAAGYIVAVNPHILSAAGMPKGALVAATSYAAAAGCFLMALLARMPIILAPGMGLNAYFAYSLCVRGGVEWQVALGIVLLSGVLFLLLSLWGLRERVLYAVPPALRAGIVVGIGLFIALIGFINMGVVKSSPTTVVTLGPITPATAVALVGVVAAVVLEQRRVPGSLLIVVVAVTVVGLLAGWVAPPERILSLPPSVGPVALQLDVAAALAPSYWVAIFIFLYVDMFDSLGSLTALCYQAGFVEDGRIKGLREMMVADAAATVVGSLLGTSTVTTYIESSAGVATGGRTGLAAVVTGVLFLAAPFFAGVVAVVPPYATGVALVLVGMYMMRHLAEIDFTSWESGAPAFVTLMLMPLTFSIATGICFGVLTHIALLVLGMRWREVSPVMWVVGALSVLYLVYHAA